MWLNYLAHTTKKTSSKIPELPGVTFPSIKDLKITEFFFFKLLDKIDVSKASGPDCIPGRILQNLARNLLQFYISFLNNL